MGLPCFEQKGFEADDIIGSLTKFAWATDHPVCIVSSDKDLMQLLTHKDTYMFDTMKNKEYRAKQVEAKMGVGPEMIIDYLGLVGDSSDNIPGVKGIGPKSASILLKQFGSMDGIYENIDSLKKNKQRENLETFKEQAYLSRDLATIRVDMDLDCDWESLKCKPETGEAMRDLLEELEFAKLAPRLARWEKGNLAAPPVKKETAEKVQYHCITRLGELERTFNTLKSAKVIAFDTETTGLQYDAELVGFSFCASDKDAFYVPLIHANAKAQCDRAEAVKLLGEFFKDHQIVGQNIKFDIKVLARYGLEVEAQQIAFDTMLASYVLAPGGRHSMDALALKYLDHNCIPYSEVCGTGKKEITFDQVEVGPATDYAAEDAWVTWRLYGQLKKLIDGNKALKSVYYDIELPLLSVLARMEREGIAIDRELLGEMSIEFGGVMEQLVEKAHALAGEEFNLASPKQLSEILFVKLGLPTIKKTKTGFSTNVEVLIKLAVHHELPEVILQYRELAKLKNTYVDVIPELANGDGRVHTSFNQTVAATGRLSSSDPNLQNIPIRTEMGRRIRGAFVARKGYVLLGADYSQIELRILAHLSQDKALKSAFDRGADIHRSTASKVFWRGRKRRDR